jgi:hypothetical protein
MSIMPAGTAYLLRMLDMQIEEARRQRKERERLRLLRHLRDDRVSPFDASTVSVLRAPLKTATKFKGAKRAASVLVAEADRKDAFIDPIEVEAHRRGLSKDEYVAAEKARRWLAEDAQRRIERARGVEWNTEQVERRLVEAWEVMVRTPVERGPRSYGSAMPDYVREWEDMVGNDEPERLSRVEVLHRLGPPTSEEARRADEILLALRRLSPLQRRAVAWCMRCEVYGVPFLKARKALGLKMSDLLEVRAQAVAAMLEHFRSG